jgi:hypothetical protein
MDNVLSEVRSMVALRVAGGFDSRKTIVQDLAEYARESYDRDDLAAQIEGITDEELAEHCLAESRWPATTDCDRLDLAFEELEAEGVVARQHFTCCSTCGHTEIGAEIAKAQADGIPVIGYVFYHMQNTECAVAGGGLYLGFGAVEDGTEAIRGVGRRIVTALERKGLKTKWSGSYTECVHVQLDWKRRRDD